MSGKGKAGKKNAKEAHGKKKPVAEGLKLQVWQSFPDNGASARASDLRVVEEVVQAIHEGAAQVHGSLKMARASVMQLDLGIDTTNLYEVSFTLLLINETEGLDKDFQEALVRSVALDIRGGSSTDQQEHPRHGKGVEIDTRSPNCDLRVVSEEENPNPSDASQPERLIALVIAADSQRHADQLSTRITALVDSRSQIWHGLSERIQDLLTGNPDEREKPTREVTWRLKDEPALRALSTDFLSYSTDTNTCLPARRGALSALILGGQDPYKNDLLRWITGVDPKQPLRGDPLAKQHRFLVVKASEFPDDFRGYRMACSIGRLQQQVLASVVQNLAEISAELELHLMKIPAEGGAVGQLSREDFSQIMGRLQLTTDGEVLYLNQGQIDELFNLADIDGDGQVSLPEFIAAFQPHDKSLQLASVDLPSGQKNKVREAADQKNEEHLGTLRTKIKVVQDSATKELSNVHAKEAKKKVEAAANLLRAKFQAAARSAQSKMDGAEKAIRINKTIIDSPAADAKALKKAHKGIADAVKDVAFAKLQLDMAQKQHDEAVEVIFRAAEAESGGASYREMETVAEIEKKLRQVCTEVASLKGRSLKTAEGETGARALYKSFASMDTDGDGRLSGAECRQGLEQLLRQSGLVVGPGMLGEIVNRMDVNSDGFVSLDEFLFHLDDSEDAKLRRAAASLDGLPCRAVYRGAAKVFTSQNGEIKSWTPVPSEDYLAVGRMYEGVLGKRTEGDVQGRYQVTFTHVRADPLARASEPSEYLYKHFSDFPSTVYTVTQVTRADDIVLVLPVPASVAYTHATLHELHTLQRTLIEALLHAIPARVQGKDQEKDVTRRIAVARSQASRHAMLHDPSHGLLRIFDDNAHLEPSALAHEGLSDFDLHMLRVRVDEAAALVETQRKSGLGTLSGLSRACQSQAPMDAFITGQVHLSLKNAPSRAYRPLLIQAPEFFAVNYPTEEGVSDILKTVRFFFADPRKDPELYPLEKQIRARFDEVDVDKSGTLNKGEFKNLLKVTVNKGEERLTPAQMDCLIELLDVDGSGTIEVQELAAVIKPRGSECPYDQMEATTRFGGLVDRIVVLVDVQLSRFNPWEKAIIKSLHRQYKRKLIFASFITVENQAAVNNPAKLLELAKGSAEDMGNFLEDPNVARQLRETIVYVGTVMEQTVDRDGNVKAKTVTGRSGPHSKWRALPNTLNRFLVKALSSEEEDAQGALHATCDSLVALTIALRKSLTRFVTSPEAADPHAPARVPLINAAQALIEAAAAAMAHTDGLEHRLMVMAVSDELKSLGKASKQAKKAGTSVLEKLGVHQMTSAEKEAAQAAQRRQRMEVEGEVRRMEVLAWTSKAHIEAWFGMVASRADASLPPESSRRIRGHLRNLISRYSVESMSELVNLDAGRVALAVGATGEALPMEERIFIQHAVNRVRAQFWGLKGDGRLAQRNAWLLVREQWLHLADLRLVYAVLGGHVTLPEYISEALRDGLLLLSAGLMPWRPLALHPVPYTKDFTSWDGSVRTKAVHHHFFSDGEHDSEGALSFGAVSADTVAEMVLQIRRETLKEVGWAPTDELKPFDESGTGPLRD